MSIRNIFFQTSIDDDIAPMEGTGLRARVKAPCPGNKYNVVLLASGWNCLEFLEKNLKNVGKCTSYVLLYDKTGTNLGAYYLEPGEQLVDVTNAPASTHFIKYGCDPNCGGEAILEFDVPYA